MFDSITNKFNYLDKTEQAFKIQMMSAKISNIREILEEPRPSEFPQAENIAEELCVEFLRTGLWPEGEEELPTILYSSKLMSLTEQINILNKEFSE